MNLCLRSLKIATKNPLVLHAQYKYDKCQVKTKRQDESGEKIAGIPILR